MIAAAIRAATSVSHHAIAVFSSARPSTLSSANSVASMKPPTATAEDGSRGREGADRVARLEAATLLLGTRGRQPGADVNATRVSGLSGFLLINPRSGKGGPAPEELRDAAAERGIDARILRDDEEPSNLARNADADALGIAGGDGSLAAVADVALERGLPFVCVPFGTRNHFARDVGLDRNDPIAALDAFRGAERPIDVGRVGERLFLNNVSLGAYALLVHRRERHRRRRNALARLRAILLTLRDREPLRVMVEGEEIEARVALVSNNDYRLDLLSLGEREQLDEGRLHLYVAAGWRLAHWEERSYERLTIDSRRNRIRAAIDGEPAALVTPLEFAIEPRALRVLLPPG